MALAAKSYNLKNGRLTLNSGVVVNLIRFKVNRKLELRDRTAGKSLTQQQVINKEMQPDIEIEVFSEGGELTMADFSPGDAVTALTFLSTETGTPSLLQSDFFTKWPVSGMCIGDVSSEWNEKDSNTFTIPIHAGILNPGAL